MTRDLVDLNACATRLGIRGHRASLHEGILDIGPIYVWCWSPCHIADTLYIRCRSSSWVPSSGGTTCNSFRLTALYTCPKPFSPGEGGIKLDDTVTFTGFVYRILPSDNASHLTIYCGTLVNCGTKGTCWDESTKDGWIREWIVLWYTANLLRNKG